MVVGCNHVANLFLSTLSLRRATNNVLPAYAACGISIHALLAESDAKNTRDYATLRNFYPRSPCGERQFAHYGNPRRLVISIHALLAESDHPDAGGIQGPRNFYPRAPCGERRWSSKTGRRFPYFYPRSPCGERPGGKIHHPRKILISIHALLAESDLRVVDGSKSSIISIHALLAESDHQTNTGSNESSEFLSTLSLRRATGTILKLQCILGNFYPRSPCGERRKKSPPMCSMRHFYPRSPCGERRPLR